MAPGAGTGPRSDPGGERRRAPHLGEVVPTEGSLLTAENVLGVGTRLHLAPGPQPFLTGSKRMPALP